MAVKVRATLEDLHHEPGKAELVNGEIIRMSPTGGRPGKAGGRIYSSLEDYEIQAGGGHAFPDNVGFAVDLPDRESFSPDAAFHTSAILDEDFVEGAPVFAAEVRSKYDYGPKAERQIAKKIADYFKAGTKVVWDVDVLREQVIRVYRSTDPDNPTIYRRGEIAEADPALPGWRMPVDRLFA